MDQTMPLSEPIPPSPAGKPLHLKELSPKHKQVCALLAQGVKRHVIADIVDYTPEYITMLSNEVNCRRYIEEMCKAAGTRLEAMFEQTVDVIADAMQNGSIEDRLKGARLQLEATKRIGRADQMALNQQVNFIVNIPQKLSSEEWTARHAAGAVFDHAPSGQQEKV